jgi:AraC-type DNA-binding domain-containing proteins
LKNHYQHYKENLADDFSFQHKITDKADTKDFHIHDAFEIMLVLSDNVKCSIGEKSYAISKNTMLLFNNMDLHQLSLRKPGVYDRYVLYFKPEYIESLSSEETDLLECFFFRPFPEPHIIVMQQEEINMFLQLLDKICACQDNCIKHLYGHDLRIKFLLGELLLFINNAYRTYHNIKTDNFTHDYSLIYSLINFIHKNLSEKLSLDKLAQQFFINKYHLCTLFKNVTGVSPNQYIINCRIIRAKELLSKNLSVETVCEITGFNNLSHFSRTFKQHIGCSPKKFSLRVKEAKTGESGSCSPTHHIP